MSRFRKKWEVRCKLLFLFSEDNGTGFSDKSLKEFHNLSNNDFPTDSNHIGLANVNARIKLIFGDDYGVQIFSDNLSQPDVQITFPKIENNDIF